MFLNLICYKKYMLFKFMVIFLELIFLFFSKCFMILFSCIMVLSFTSSFWVFKDNCSHNIILIASSMATNSASVLILVFDFWLLDIDITAPCPINIIIQVRLLKSWYMENDMLTYHLIVLVLSADRIKIIS